MSVLHITRQVMRRFILGRQGLWPGRRWRGKEGVVQAVRYAESVQIDPLNVAGRSHDIALWGRVLDYSSALLDELLYKDRLLFEYGGNFRLYPISDLPYWRIAMREAARNGRWARYAREGGAAMITRVRSELRRRGPLGSRDFSAEGQARVDSYRARKDSGMALYYLWITGETLIRQRARNERVYDYRRALVDPALNRAAALPAAERHFARKALAMRGLSHIGAFRSWVGFFRGRAITHADAKARLERMLRAGEAATVSIEGEADPHYLPAQDAPALAMLADGQVPPHWSPLQATTAQEAVFMAPLEIVSGLGRALRLFDFEYKWEVYTPARQRRWGYYVLPVLWGDRLVARFNPKVDRAGSCLTINSFRLEDERTGKDGAFAEALGRGLARFARFAGVNRVDLDAIEPPRLRREAKRHLS